MGDFKFIEAAHAGFFLPNTTSATYKAHVKRANAQRSAAFPAHMTICLPMLILRSAFKRMLPKINSKSC
jgi:hypothetical protein